ncbi:MAG: helix-turn-helix domain-containing protein [Pseudonocardiaceae bacterium]
MPVVRGWHPAPGTARPRTFGSSAGASACAQPGAGAVSHSVVCFTAVSRATVGGRETRSTGVSPVLGDVRLGAVLRELRMARGLTLVVVARQAPCTVSLLSYVESGQRALQPWLAQALDRIYVTGSVVASLARGSGGTPAENPASGVAHEGRVCGAVAARRWRNAPFPTGGADGSRSRDSDWRAARRVRTSAGRYRAQQ